MGNLRFLKTAALGLGLTVGSIAAASASPTTFVATSAIPFTWNPSAIASLGTTQGPFTATSFSLFDFSAINVPANPAPSGSVTESGFLLPSQFLNAGSVVASANVKGTASFGIYEDFSATSHLAPCTVGTQTGVCGAFDSITASVYAYSTANGVASVTFPGNTPTITLPTGATPILLATETGPFGSSANFVNILSGVPGAAVDTLFTPQPGMSGPGNFFVSPTAIALDLDQTFTNTSGVVTTIPAGCTIPGTACTFLITAGGGQGNFIKAFTVPEPGTLAILGVSLAALGFVRRRRA